jgi:hypothetical protein
MRKSLLKKKKKKKGKHHKALFIWCSRRSILGKLQLCLSTKPIDLKLQLSIGSGWFIGESQQIGLIARVNC